ncbi:MAG: T9SS type A sorting domain-containing protein, partial [Dinghuibacter sp.]|nr:T9SS type A sorting domain-containing protein [Dinghuibacter sp.]
DTNTVYYINMDAGVVNDLAGHPFAGINDNSTWKFTTTPLGPPIYVYNLNNCTGTLPQGLTRFSAAGDSVWSCTSFGYNGTSGVQMNGFSNGDNEDWLILPRLNLTGMNIPLLNFKCRTKFTGPQLTLLVSTNYSGTGNPNTATWTEVNGDFPNVNTDIWDTSNYADLTNWKTAATSIAWKYTSSAAAGASRWTIDDIVVFGSPIPYVAQVYTDPVYLNLGYTPSGSVSPVKTFRFNASNFNNPLTVKCVKGFELSKDGSSFTDTALVYSPAELLQGGKTVSVRFKPAVADTVYSGSVVFTNSNFTWARKPFITATSANPARTLEIVNWNIEWFGSTANGPTDENLQEANVLRAMRYLDADIYAFQEIVDTLRFKRLADSMGVNYSYHISYYCSGATSATSSNYNSGQKLGIIYNKVLLPQLAARPYMASSSSAYTNWASGRFPYQLTGNLVLDGQNKPIELYVLHGKAGATNSDYQRRKDGAREFKDSLDATSANANIFIVGDFNDDLDYSILGGVTPSSYEDIVKDSTDNNHYRSVSLALSSQGLSSTLSFPEMIDHQVVSNETASWYIGGSIALRTDVALVVPGYLTGNTTDHYPVYGRYLIRNIVTGIRPVPQTLTGVTVFPNPARNRVTIKMLAEPGNVHVELFDATGKLLLRKDYLGTNTLQQYTVDLPSLLTGVYYLKITNRNKMATKTIVIE